MVDKLVKKNFWFVLDKIGDGIINCVDELKFWTEVGAEFF